MAALLSYALTTKADVKESLGIASSDTSWDNLIIRKINQATRQIEAYCNRRFKATDYTDEEYVGTNTDQLVLKNRPIIGVVSLGARDTSLNDGNFNTVETDLYFPNVESGVLDLNFTATGHWGRYAVTYRGGYETIPDDLAEACATLAAYYTLNSDGGNIGVSSKREGQRQVSYSNGTMTFDNLMENLGIDGIINSYANIPVATD